MTKLYLVVCLCGCFMICSCKPEKSASHISIIPFKGKAKQAKKVIVQSANARNIHDGKQIQGDIELFHPIGSDSAIIVDGSRNIHLLVADSISVSLTNYKGKGPGQYHSIKAIEYHNDTLFVLDKSLKLLAYSLSTKSYLLSYSLQPKYLTATSFVRTGKDGFLFMDGTTYPHESAYEQMNSSPIFQRLAPQGQAKELSLRKNDWPTVHVSRPVSMGIGNSIRKYGPFVVGRIGLSPYVSVVNLDNEEISLIELGHINMPLNQQSKNSNQDMEILDAIQNIFALPEYVAVAIQKVKEQEIIIQFYLYSGEFIHEVNIGKTTQNGIENLTVVNVTNRAITLLGVNTNINSQSPHSLLNRIYTWE
jgi:hypothetical protein